MVNHDHNPLNADFHGGICPACESSLDEKAQEIPNGPVQNFYRFLTQAGPPSTKDNPTPKPWSAAMFAYVWVHTTHCPPEGTL